MRPADVAGPALLSQLPTPWLYALCYHCLKSRMTTYKARNYAFNRKNKRHVTRKDVEIRTLLTGATRPMADSPKSASSRSCSLPSEHMRTCTLKLAGIKPSPGLHNQEQNRRLARAHDEGVSITQELSQGDVITRKHRWGKRSRKGFSKADISRSLERRT